MSNSSDQLEEIKTLISSGSKCLAYLTLLHFQEQSSDDPTSIQALAGVSQTLLSLIVADISYDVEEIAALALKCLGFMIYHPSLVVVIAADDANLVIESLVRLIMTTKMEAVIHALDNPIGSLSTTFEAIQVLIKLASNLSERMRDLSHLWAPPIYRRLLSFDKKERDMSERCLLKIKPIILPPPLVLSKLRLQSDADRITPMHEEQSDAQTPVRRRPNPSSPLNNHASSTLHHKIETNIIFCAKSYQCRKRVTTTLLLMATYVTLTTVSVGRP